MTKASFYQCPGCKKVFIREGQKRWLRSDCIHIKRPMLCPRVFKWVCVCGAEQYTYTATAMFGTCKCGNPKRWKREKATL